LEEWKDLLVLNRSGIIAHVTDAMGTGYDFKPTTNWSNAISTLASLVSYSNPRDLFQVKACVLGLIFALAGKCFLVFGKGITTGN
jgi:hypothetical protein